VLFTLVGLLFVALALPLMRRAIKPNALYGLRVPATFASEWVWYEANATTGRDFTVLGVLQVAVALFVRGVSEEIYVAANIGFMLVGVLTVAVIGWRRANRLLESAADGPRS
jgi:uncharacterized membrane protein